MATVAVLLAVSSWSAWALDQELVKRADEALHKCVTYLTEEVAYHGGYGGSYLADLSDQWGEGHIERYMNWVQPPGSPYTGEAFMAAWRATGDDFYLQAAKQVADALVWGQLECGGWDYNTDFSEKGEQTYYYLHNKGSDDPKLTSGRNRGTFDDNTTEAAIRLLIEVDAALEQKDQPIHGAALAGMEYVLRAQFDFGGFPQWYPLASRGYSNFATYNDWNMYYIMYVLMAAWEQYQDQRYRDSLDKLGGFFISSQMPEPQPVWCQQYDADMQPAWARRFEPPAVTAGESSGVMRALIEMALYTGEGKYLEPIPRALAWYKRSQLPNGKWARFYELKTNKPLYMTSDNRTSYWLTYSDSDLPDHYSFNGSSYPTSVERDYDAITAEGLEKYREAHKPVEMTAEQKVAKAETMEEAVRKVLDEQTEKGVWLRTSEGRQIIDMGTVQSRMRTLSDYLRYANNR